jgi:hypothetical protein
VYQVRRLLRGWGEPSSLHDPKQAVLDLKNARYERRSPSMTAAESQDSNQPNTVADDWPAVSAVVVIDIGRDNYRLRFDCRWAI